MEGAGEVRCHLKNVFLYFPAVMKFYLHGISGHEAV